MACPPVSAPNCREDQFLVEVRGEKSCCYSYLCGTFFNCGSQVSLKLKVEVVGVWSAICYVSISTPPTVTATKMIVLFLSEQCVSRALNPFQRVHMEKSWLWISTPPAAAVLNTIVVSMCVCERECVCTCVFVYVPSKSCLYIF